MYGNCDVRSLPDADRFNKQGTLQLLRHYFSKSQRLLLIFGITLLNSQSTNIKVFFTGLEPAAQFR